jgi:hypothetical protein
MGGTIATVRTAQRYARGMNIFGVSIVSIVSARIACRLRCALSRTTGLILIGVMITAALSGCATSVNKLSRAEIATLNIASVDIRFAPNAHIWWGKAEREYAAQPGVQPASGAPQNPPGPTIETASLPGDRDGDDYREVMDTPEAKQYLRDKLAGMIRSRLQQTVLPNFRGTRNVRLEIVVHSFRIPSPLQRVALGGHPTLGAITTLRDATTGEELGKLDRAAASYAGNGVIGVLVDQAFSDLEDRVLEQYVSNVRSWLDGE